MKTKTPKVIWKQLTIRVPVEVHRALKVRAAEEGRSLAVIIEGLVREYLVGGKAPKPVTADHAAPDEPFRDWKVIPDAGVKARGKKA